MYYLFIGARRKLIGGGANAPLAPLLLPGAYVSIPIL